MGFNLSGLVINKNYENNFENLQKELGWKLKKQSDINFETASANWKDKGICDVFFTEQGTILFISMDMCTDAWRLKNANTLTFVLSEISMSFYVNYCENGLLKRSIIELNDKRIQDEGEKLKVEDISEDTSEIIWNQIDNMLGKSFGSIQPDEKAIRYVFLKNDEKTIEKIKRFKIDETFYKEELSNSFSDEDLFKYFDKIVKFAQNNNINIFLDPLSYRANFKILNILHNLSMISSEILNRPHLLNEINKRIDYEFFQHICKMNPLQLNDDEKLGLMKGVYLINTDHNQKPELKKEIKPKQKSIKQPKADNIRKILNIIRLITRLWR